MAKRVQHPLPVVDDGSTDRTAELLRALQRQAGECVVVMELSDNVEKAEAIQLGVLAALEQQPDCVGCWDADPATPLRSIPDFC